MTTLENGPSFQADHIASTKYFGFLSGQDRIRLGSGWVFIGFYRVRSGSGNNPFEFILGGKTKLGTKILENGQSFRAEHIVLHQLKFQYQFYILSKINIDRYEICKIGFYA